MAEKDPVVRPKTGQSGRPYSVSKDEAYARMLQSEEESAALEKDEEFARQLQEELNMEERRKMQESLANRPPLRSMTPITQLFSSLVHANHRGLHGSSGQDSENEDNGSDNESTDSDSTVAGAAASTTSTSTSSTSASTTSASPRSGASTRGRGRAPTRRVIHGVRPAETAVLERPTAASRGGRGTSRGVNRGRRGQGTSRGRGGTRGSQNYQGSNTDNETGETRTTRNRRSLPRTMEPAVPPLSLAINQPELPDGEMEPEILILDQGDGDPNSDTRYVHIMRDPLLLLLFLMGRAPDMLVPDNIDANDYESLWQLAEEVGEVKNRGLPEKDLRSLPCKMFNKRTKVSGNNQDHGQCLVCLSTYTAGNSICTLPCQGKHEFHENCIKEWLKRNASCPICRHEIKPS